MIATVNFIAGIRAQGTVVVVIIGVENIVTENRFCNRITELFPGIFVTLMSGPLHRVRTLGFV